MSHDESLTRERTQQLAYRLWQEAGCPEGQADRLWREAEGRIAAAEIERDRELAASFPASDPPSASGMTGPVRADPPVRVAAPLAAPPLAAPPLAMRPPAVSPLGAPPPAAPAPPAKGWRAAASRYFAAWWAYPAKPGSS